MVVRRERAFPPRDEMVPRANREASRAPSPGVARAKPFAMLWSSMLMSLLMALVFAILLVLVFGWRRPRARAAETVGFSIVYVFAILFLATWAFSGWVTPAGPVAYGIRWMMWPAIAILVSLLVIAMAPPPHTVPAAGIPVADEAVTATGFGLAFWVLMVLLAVFAITGSVG